MSVPLALTPLATPRTYKLTTTSVVRLNEAEERNTYTTVARQTLLERKPNNTYRLALEVLHFEAENPTFFNALAADLNQVSNSLIIQTDIYGRLDRIENKAELLQTWRRLKPTVVEKYRQYYPPAFFEAFEQNLRTEGVFEKTLRHKGLHGVLLAGLYGYGYVPEVPVVGTRVIEQFFNNIDLPLKTSLEPVADSPSGTLTLHLTGALHQAALRQDDLRRLLRSMAGNPLLKVSMQANCQERYELATATGALVRAEQQLQAEIPGIYRNELHHQLETIA